MELSCLAGPRETRAQVVIMGSPFQTGAGDHGGGHSNLSGKGRKVREDGHTCSKVQEVDTLRATGQDDVELVAGPNLADQCL